MPGISKYSSIVYRISQIYFDDRLAPYQIGGGQQFFLLRIYDSPGINQYQLAQKGHFDKGTTARAVKKLEDLGYIKRIVDENDRRFTKLYVSDKGKPLIQAIKEVVNDWYDILVQGFDEVECKIVDALMRRVADNARQYVVTKQREDT